MFNKQMHEVSVFIGGPNEIFITQATNDPQNPETIVLHPDQVDLLVKWLQEARDTLRAQAD